MTKQQIRMWGVNAAMTLSVVAVFWLFIEGVVFKPFLTRIPLCLQQRLPEPVQMLAQISKAGIMPRNYTLILGDSYANGWGDWLQSTDITRNLPYGVHDGLHDLTDLDVVHMGFAGGSPLDVLIRKPINRFRYLQKLWLYHPEPPAQILWFYYEGNDLSDNLDRLKTVYKGKFDIKRVGDDAYFQRFLEEDVLKSDALYYDVRRFRWNYQLVAFHFFREIAQNLFLRHPKSAAQPHVWVPGTNVFQTSGQNKQLPRDVETPPVYLSGEPLRLSLYMTGQCLDYLSEFFPHAAVTIVYVPSPITCYPITSKKVHVWLSYPPQANWATGVKKGPTSVLMDTKEVFESSDRLYEALRGMAAERQISVIDTRQAMRAAAARWGFLHGPTDYNHFNKVGYAALAGAVNSQLDLTPDAPQALKAVNERLEKMFLTRRRTIRNVVELVFKV